MTCKVFHNLRILSSVYNVYQLALAAAMLHNKQPHILAFDHKVYLLFRRHIGCRVAVAAWFYGSVLGARQTDLLQAFSHSVP